MPRERATNISANAPRPAANATTCSEVVNATAITISATRSSTTETVSMNARSELGKRRPTSASIPSANAVSVDIAVPQAPVGACEPAIAKKIRTGTIIPPIPATTGSSNRRRSRRSPRSNSRRASSPTTKKNNVISPELTQWRRSSETPAPPTRTLSDVVQTRSYEVPMLAQISAQTAPASRNAADPVSVRRKSRSGASRLRAQAVRPEK